MVRKILITGTNRGLGFSLTKIFLEKKDIVFTLNRTLNTNLKELNEKFKDNLFIFKVDVTNEAKIQNIVQKISKITSSIDILINNAAVHLEEPAPDLGEINLEIIKKTFEINSIAPLNVINNFIELVKNSDIKLIVNISSEAGSISNCRREREYGYCMSKVALNMMSQILQNRLKNEEIKVLAIHPGWFSSKMGGEEAPITPDDAAKNVARIILKDWTLNDPIFIDSKTGDRMNW
ncbi:MAG: SDR family NAD(P)-dependent oxidoreductase [Candidatus Hermodarchaeota archaeon]